MYKKSEKLKLIRRGLEDAQCLGVSIRNAGIKSDYTVGLWRKRPMIARYIDRCIEKSASRRDNAVVDSLFKQAIGGNPTCIAIYLKFKMGWREAYVGPPVNVFTQVWMRAAEKAKDIDVNGRVHIGHKKEVSA